MIERIWDWLMVALGYRVPRRKREAAGRMFDSIGERVKRQHELDLQFVEIMRPFPEREARLARNKGRRMRYAR